MTIFITSVICMLLHGQTNRRTRVVLHHFGSFLCAVSPRQLNRCLTSDIDSRQQQRSHTCKWSVTQSGSFYTTLLYHFKLFVYRETDSKARKYTGSMEYVNCICFSRFLIIPLFIYTECYCMIFFCINMYLKICMPYAFVVLFAMLAFPFSSHLSSPSYDLYHFYSPAFCFSP